MQEPKKRNRSRVTRRERHDWLRMHEEDGYSLGRLAKKTGRNIRTVSAHVELAMQEREMAVARTETYRQALTEHYRELQNVLEKIRGTLWIPPDERLTTYPHFGARFPRHTGLSITTLDNGDLQVSAPELNARKQKLFVFVREHFPGENSLWNRLRRWFADLEDYARRCIHLGQMVGETALNRTGLGLAGVDGSDQGLHEGFIGRMCRLAIEEKYTQVKEDVEKGLATEGSELRHGGTVLAKPSPGEPVEKVRDDFVEILDWLRKEGEVMGIANVRKKLERDLPELSDQLEDLLLLHMLPGRCSVCKRMGL